MGMKRPLEVEEFAEPTFRQPKQRDYNRNLTLNAEEYHITTLAVQSPGEADNSSCQLYFEQFDDNEANNFDKELVASAPLSLVTSSSSEEDAVVGETPDYSCFPRYIDISIPRHPPRQFDDPYVSLLSSPPRKEIPVGPDYQADVPLWNPNSIQIGISGSIYITDDDREEKLMGTCIIAMPDLNDSPVEGVGVGRGRTDCSCMDMGSMRCVQQHVNEARETLRETIGGVNFVELGFCNMGEEVAYQWTPHDEQVFHDIVYSNPASHHRRFWKHLSAAFATRTKSELVSYYFNVFMHRRRAVQNRSYLLEIDSDDDEELIVDIHGGSYQNRSYPSDMDEQEEHNGDGHLVEEEEDEEVSTVESFGDEDLDASWVDDFWSEPQNVCGDEASNLFHNSCDGKVEEIDDASVQMNARTKMMAGEDDDEILHDDPRLYT